jgi:putative transcriptional regulator
MQLGNTVYRLRLAKGLTQRALADRAKLHVETISRLETGTQENITIESLRRIAAALGTTAAKLLGAARG